jgi:hypothetical protein
MYYIERLIIGTVWCVSLISIWFIPMRKLRQASFIFLVAQLPSWLFGLLVVEAGWIEYPVRELYKANATSFTFEYLVLPIICIFFNLHYPENRGLYEKIKYYLYILSIFTLIEYFTEKYTLIIHYIHWEWYITLITMAIFLYMIRIFYKWFYNMGNIFSL